MKEKLIRRTVIGEEFTAESVKFTLIMGLHEGNSTTTEITFESVSLENEKPVILKIYGECERDALSKIFKTLSEELLIH